MYHLTALYWMWRTTLLKTAYNRMKKICFDNWKAKWSGAYLYGLDKGSGKTHLAHCVRQELIKKNVPVLCN